MLEVREHGGSDVIGALGRRSRGTVRSVGTPAAVQERDIHPSNAAKLKWQRFDAQLMEQRETEGLECHTVVLEASANRVVAKSQRP